MLWSPGRDLWTPPSVVPLLGNLSPLAWEQGTRPWHQDPRWGPGRAWCPGLDTQRRMHTLGIIFPSPAFIRRGGAEIGTGAGSGAPAGPSIATPLSFYRLEEASGTRVDSASGGNDLTPTGTPGNAAGQLGFGIALNGTTQNLHSSPPSGMGLGTGVSFSIGLWVFATSLSAGDGSGLASRCNGSVTTGYDFFINSSGFRCYAHSISNGLKTLNANGTTPSTSTWYNVVLTYDSGATTLKIRVNDTTESTLSTVSDITDASQAFILGNEPVDGSFLAGRLDACGYWQSALSTTDVTAFYNLGVGTEYYSGVWH